MQPKSIEEFERKSSILFFNRVLLQQLFVHRSYVNEQMASQIKTEELLADNERLEFLGDSVLGFITSDLLYSRFPELQEGKLTHIRTTLVRRETLAKFAAELSMGDYLLLGIGEEEGGGRTRIPTLCATYEALIGALFLDQGLDGVRRYILPRIEAELLVTQGSSKDAKSRLQEWAQETSNATPRYKLAEATGPDHNKTFVMRVDISHTPYGIGKGRSKADATQAAAAMALHRHSQPAPEYVQDIALEQAYGF